MERRADLHVHTYYSDGTFSPEDVVIGAKKGGLSGVAVCDHDCIDAIAECCEVSDDSLEIIPGVEVTAEIDGIEIHILGYFVDTKAKPLVRLLEGLKKSRVDRVYAMVDKLKEQNVNISPEEVFALGGKGTVGRMHLAVALHRSKQVTSVKEAFVKYIADYAPCYVSRFNAGPEETIGAILNAGGVPVYAHPGTMGRDDFIPRFVKAGLRGLEVYHSDHNKRAIQYYLALAQKYGLLITGGSDCHGDHKGRIGDVSVPYSIVENLRKESHEQR